MKGQEWAALLRKAAADERAECAARRARVLAYVDLRARLTQAPLFFSTPDMWNGRLPPAMHGDQMNTSPRRRALVEISAEALRREREEQEAGET